jgi:hypothetical protein
MIIELIHNLQLNNLKIKINFFLFFYSSITNVYIHKSISYLLTSDVTKLSLIFTYIIYI